MLKSQGNIDIKGLAEELKKSSVKTPYTNIGGLETQKTPQILTTETFRGLQARKNDSNFLDNGYKLDWLAFTVTYEQYLLEEILGVLKYGVHDFEDIPGRYFYNSGLTLGRYVNIFYNDKEKPIFKNSSDTINFIFTGQGCTDLALKFNNDIYKIFELLNDFNVKITRLDLAYDDFHKFLNFEEVKSKLNKAEFRSSKKSFNIVRSSNVNGETLGETIYIGSPRSKHGYYLRMYDKKAQYIEKNQILPDIVEKTGVWQRYEISFTKSKAHEVFLYLLFDDRYKNNVDCLFKEVLRNIVEFLDVKYTKNGNIDKKYRWCVCSWWDDFLYFDNKVGFVNHERDVDFGGLLKWLTVSVVPNLKLLELIFDGFGYNFFEFLKSYNFEKTFSKKQNRLLNNAELLTDEQFNEYLTKYFKLKGDKNENL